jgi:hypothetical protein
MKTISNTVLKTATLFLMLMIFSMTTARPADVTGPYLGQTPPGNTPEMFAPGIISLTNRLEGTITFSPDGKECFFTVWNPGGNWTGKVFHSRCVSNVWTAQTEASFSVGHSTTQPFFSADGNEVTFEYNGFELWQSQRSGEDWGTPQRLPSPIYSGSGDFGYSETAAGIAYFASTRPGGKGGGDIWRTRQVPGQPLQAEVLTNVNSSRLEYSVCIAPDESYLLFISTRPGGNGAGDMYVSLKNSSGGFGAPINMNNFCPGLNTSADEDGPMLSSDARYLFFGRYRNVSGVETDDIYWVANPMIPKLAITLNNTNVTLSWNTNFTNFTLESTAELNGVWTPVSGVTGSPATLPVNAATNQFFRLRH